MAASLPYEEPGIVDVLVLSTFLLALNLINSALNRTLYCGLVGQVLIGVAWGTPGAKWLSESLEHSIVQLGYLGLIMIVFEGGLSSSLATMKANLVLSSCVAFTGVATPMALSFLLGPMVGASPIQCFAAGAALCSTSLGTTFTVLSTSGLVSTRLGSVLSTAAMMDDVAGLVMVQIVSSLGSSSSRSSSSSVNISAPTIIRPILVSVAFALVVPLACRFVLGPAMAGLQRVRTRYAGSNAEQASRTKESVFLAQTALLLALITAASYAGASVLLAAYLAGIAGAYWQDTATRCIKSSRGNANASPNQETVDNGIGTGGENATLDMARTSPSEMYQHCYAQSIERVLKPFFFASIGFSIPISNMFTSAVVWRGIVYTILMTVGKGVCGIWLIRFSPPLSEKARGSFSSITALLRRLPLGRFVKHRVKQDSRSTSNGPDNGDSRDESRSTAVSQQQAGDTSTPSTTSPDSSSQVKPPSKPLSLYPAGIMSFAMIARGEIGFLISSVAESGGIFSAGSTPSNGASEMFLIITWAIVLCTIVGPFCVGLLVRRVKKLEAARVASPAGSRNKDVLGAWGVS
ncbi:Sodium/hydrogen exchanger family-domain-containing protein [Coniella lustricola]|uniref:Sodium/hydrogen exchanger family-domain-containing protein n=1 Tax=Coniella lustricola TaxID=2025994 RepID=A0A2T2ZUM4_9PEZI|nr:Sodium/hydrogen exchanger family-domain-containing protein [Coniella lustricola]